MSRAVDNQSLFPAYLFKNKEESMVQRTNYSRSDLLRLEPLKLHEYLTDNFTITIPDRLDSVEEVSRTAELISKTTAYYSFLENMRVEANLKKTIYKDYAANTDDPDLKKAYQKESANMLKREQIFESMVKIMDRTYQSISRMITIKQQVNKEIEMSGKV